MQASRPGPIVLLFRMSSVVCAVRVLTSKEANFVQKPPPQPAAGTAAVAGLSASQTDRLTQPRVTRYPTMMQYICTQRRERPFDDGIMHRP